MEVMLDPDDGLPVQDVGFWAEGKHEMLRRYVVMSGPARRKHQRPGQIGACYIDLFSGPGRAFIRDHKRYAEGSALNAWSASVQSKAPFDSVHIADLDPVAVAAAATRLERAGAPVIKHEGAAVDTVKEITAQLPEHGLHLAFLDPFSIGALDFSIIETLASALQRVDIIVHIAALDLRRNLDHFESGSQKGLDAFAPGWREAVDPKQSRDHRIEAVVDYWRRKVASLGVFPSLEMRPIRNNQGHLLYWLALLARHPLAHEFWAVASNPQKQRSLF